MKLLVAFVAAAFAASCNNKLASLAKQCGRDYEDHCSQVDKSNLVSVLACGKSHQGDLQPECLAEIQKNFPALFACTEDLTAACPGFGKVSRSQWGNDNDDDDDSGRRHRQPPPSSLPPPLPPRKPDSSVVPQPDLVKPVPVPPAQSEPVEPVDPASSSEGYNDYFTWDYISEDDQASSSSFNALHSQGRAQDSRQCFLDSYAAFSAPCLNAIAEQWATVETAKGLKDLSPPTAEDAYSMMAPPASTTSPWKKTNRALFFTALAFFVCTLVTCLCCCCRRCKKRRSARVIPSEGHQEVALTPFSDSVPMAAPVRFAPAPIQQTPTYIPYTGQGLSAYVPLAQPVQV